MNIKDMVASLDYMFKAEVTPFIWGHAGIGKSSAVKQYAQAKGYKYFPFYLGTMSDTGDILGLASFVKDANGSEIATQFAPPIWLKDMVDYCVNNPDSGAVIFLDEFNRGRRDLLNGMFSLALDKTFHTIRLPKNCHVIAAGNPPTDEYFTTDVNETALMARFVHVKLEPSFEEWVEYARKTNIDPTIISFLQEQPKLLADAKSDFTLPVKVDPRSMERWNKLKSVGTPDYLLEQLLQGIIGTERLVAYKLHLLNSDKPFTGEQVLKGEGIKIVQKWSESSNVKSSLITGTCDNLIDYLKAIDAGKKSLDDSESKNLIKFLETIPKEIFYATCMKMLKLEVQSFREVQKNPKYKTKMENLARESLGKVAKEKETSKK